MKKNRCFKLTALLLAITMMISIIPSFALGATQSKGTYVEGIETTELDSTFVESAKILDASNKEVKDLSAADPNGSFTLNLKVKESPYAESDEEKLPSNTTNDTTKVLMCYSMENMTAESGENSIVSWEYDADENKLYFDWKQGKQTSFEASIKIYPNYPATNDISGSYVLGTATKVMMSVGNFEDGNRVRVRSSAFTEENGMIRPVTDVNPVWTLTHVTGDYYTIKSRNTGKYLYISCKTANGYKEKSLYLVDADEETAQKILVKDKGNGYYSFHYNGGAITNVGSNVFYGFATYVNANAGNADNEKFKLYPESSLVQEPTHNLSGTWVIQSINRILSSESKQAGKLYAIGYNTAADNDSILIPNDNVKTWTFTNVVRDWYTISSEGKYLNIKNGSVSVSDQPQNLMIRSDDNFATIIISNGEFDTKGNTYCLRNQKDNDNFESVMLGTGVNTDASKAMTLLSEERIAKNSEAISGSWAIITESSGAVLLNQLSNGKLASAPYSKTENGVFIFGQEIPTWTFNQVDGGWYTIQTPDGKYLSINGKNLSLSESRTEVLVQEYNGKIRITSGKQFALKNADGNPNNGYNINDQGKAKDANEWHTLSRLDLEAGQFRTIVFDANGGTTDFVPEAVKGKVGETITLPNMEATKDGHAFMGWAEVENFFAINPKTKQTYNDLYKPGETYTYNFNASEKTLYAVYNTEANQKIQFGIRLDGVIQDEPNDYDKGAYKGHFWEDGILKESRWAIDIDSTKQVNGYYVENDVTACLNWVPSVEKITQYLKKDGNITFDPETQYIHYYVLKKTPGGDWHVDGVIRNKANIEVTYNVNVPVNDKLAVANMPGSYQVAPGTEIIIGTPKDSSTVLRPIREGYLFNGWNTKSDGSGTSYSEGHYVELTGNLNLYAQWIDIRDGKMVIIIHSDWPDGKLGYIGAKIKLTAELSGFDGRDYTLQWQYADGNTENWVDIPGANTDTYIFTLDEVNTNYNWRCVARDVR